MTLIAIKAGLCLVLMLGLLAMAFTAQGSLESNFFASLAIIIGAVASQNLSTQG